MLEAIQRIGKGSSCQVYTVLNKSDNKLYAIKESSSKENEDIIKNEVSVFKILNNESPYIVHFYDFFEGKNEKNKPCLCIQIEYCEYGSIREILKKAKKKNIKISELEISAIIYHVLQGIDFIHKKKLVNRDIKGRNILVGKNGSVKLCDFGICKKYIKNGMKKYRGGSPYWMAPEILKKEEYFQNIDIWALGITCIELAEYEPPYSKYSPEEVLKKIIKNPPKGLAQPEMWSYEFNDFVKKCLELDKNKRPSAEELLKHDFIVNLDKKNLNKNLIIYKFLIKCGYKVLYNKKERIPKNLCLNKINNLNIFDINNIYNSNDKKNAFYKKINNNNMLLDEGLRLKLKLKFNETNINSFSNRKKNSNDINMIYINDKNQRELSPLVVNRQQIRKSVQYRNNKIKSVNKKIYIRPQSLEKVNINTNSTEENDKNIIKNENKINYIPYKTSNSNINNMNNTNSKENKESKKNKNYNFKKNNVIYLNITNYRNINPINPIMVNTNNTEGSEKKYEPILSEENDINDINDFNLDEKILDTKIKSLEKERDFMLKNIINKYQDKIAKINQEKNNLMMKYSLKNNSINNNIKMKKGSINSIDNFVNNIVNNLKNKYDYSASTTTSNK